MDDKTAREIFEATLRASISYRQNYRQEVPLSFLLVYPDGRVGHLPAVEGASKQELVEFVRSVSAKSGAVYVLSVGEAWCSATPGAPPSQQADRFEVLMVTIEGPDLHLVATVPITKSGTVEQEPEVVDNFSGTFSNLAGYPEEYH
jgi:hypothetical protein